MSVILGRLDGKTAAEPVIEKDESSDHDMPRTFSSVPAKNIKSLEFSTLQTTHGQPWTTGQERLFSVRR